MEKEGTEYQQAHFQRKHRGKGEGGKGQTGPKKDEKKVTDPFSSFRGQIFVGRVSVLTIFINLGKCLPGMNE